MKLPVQEIQMNAAKCLILLGSRGQKPGKSGFGVELGWPALRVCQKERRPVWQLSTACSISSALCRSSHPLTTLIVKEGIGGSQTANDDHAALQLLRDGVADQRKYGLV
jgi:hypothetical protein